ncbi:imidazole glycerol phosphate synthase subunit HisH 2 [Leptolinea sp. HRD-7]|nr:imidazole glycerol phosphate synthase subunit HisH 2 [Leptolinea sp. HRD-7]
MIVIVDYGLGNLGSIKNMLKKAGFPSIISDDPVEIEKADKIILPGVGAFDTGMRYLQEKGMLSILNHKAMVEKVPVLGLCLGAQLITKRSEEGVLPGLGWVDGETVRFHFDNGAPQLKVPHMGWNVLQIVNDHPYLFGLPEDQRFYFVHSYHMVCRDEKNVIATTTYGYTFSSIIGQGNVVGMQFHPEKSHKFGLQVLGNFARS